jgi:hypothetical protein
VIVISGGGLGSGVDDVAMATVLGAATVLLKPFPPAVLIAAIAAAAAGRSLGSSLRLLCTVCIGVARPGLRIHENGRWTKSTRRPAGGAATFRASHALVSGSVATIVSEPSRNAAAPPAKAARSRPPTTCSPLTTGRSKRPRRSFGARDAGSRSGS